MGRKPDVIPNNNEAAWQLSEKGWIYIIGDARRAGKSLFTLIVDDLDSYIAKFKNRGISFEFTEEDSAMYRRVVVTDPDGNTLQFTELKKEADNQA